MMIAIACSNGNVHEDLATAPDFTLFELKGADVVQQLPVAAAERRERPLSMLLNDYEVDLLICGKVTLEEKRQLFDAGIKLVSNVEGKIDPVLVRYLKGELF